MTLSRSQVIGERKLRRLLKRAEPAIKKDYRPVARQIGENILAQMKRLAPVSDRQGPHLRDALSARVSPDGLSVSVGLTTKKKRRDFFYARFIERGTKGYAKRNIPPMQARPFMQPAFDLTKRENQRLANEMIKRALRKISGDAR